MHVRSTCNSLVSRIKKTLHIRPSALKSTRNDSRPKGSTADSGIVWYQPPTVAGSHKSTPQSRQIADPSLCSQADNKVTSAMALFQNHINRTQRQSQTSIESDSTDSDRTLPDWPNIHTHTSRIKGGAETGFRPNGGPDYPVSFTHTGTAHDSIRPSKRPSDSLAIGTGSQPNTYGIRPIIDRIRDGEIRLLVQPSISYRRSLCAAWVDIDGVPVKEDVSYLAPTLQSILGQVDDEKRRMEGPFWDKHNVKLAAVAKSVKDNNGLSGDKTFQDVCVGTCEDTLKLPSLQVFKQDLKDMWRVLAK